VKKFIETAEVGQVSEPKFENSTATYSIVKLVSKSAEVDSVKINMVTVQGAKTLQDSVLNLLNNGKTLADLKEIQGVDGQEDQWQVIMNANDSLRHKLLNAPAGYFALESTDEASFLCKVVEKKAPKTMYNIAQIEHKVYPSTETVNGLTDKLQEFISTNNTAALFEENAVKAGYNCVETTLTPSTAQIDRIESTRKAIQWAFEAKAGKVSAIFDKENNNKLLVVAVDDIYNEYAPLSDLQVNTAVSTKVMNDKKATEIMAKLEGKKTLDEFAQAMGVTEIDSTQVTFGQAFIPKIGTGEAELTAQVAAAKEGTVVGPIKGNTGVYAFVVTKSDARQREVTDLESDRTFAAYRGNQAVMQNAVAILRKAVKVEKDMIRFF
jgi:peptidyl-prolyl cis-trans isomerase D